MFFRAGFIILSLALHSVLALPTARVIPRAADCTAQCQPMQQSLASSSTAGVAVLCTTAVTQEYQACLGCEVAVGIIEQLPAQAIADSLVSSCQTAGHTINSFKITSIDPTNAAAPTSGTSTPAVQPSPTATPTSDTSTPAVKPTSTASTPTPTSTPTSAPTPTSTSVATQAAATPTSTPVDAPALTGSSSPEASSTLNAVTPLDLPSVAPVLPLSSSAPSAAVIGTAASDGVPIGVGAGSVAAPTLAGSSVSEVSSTVNAATPLGSPSIATVPPQFSSAPSAAGGYLPIGVGAGASSIAADSAASAVVTGPSANGAARRIGAIGWVNTGLALCVFFVIM
ncbi:hypothetical protein B0H16DRAFT_162261 [Mycena metata]|uniref:Uncharacterized protein n=1 Tax=Mycena metata TaxID=1033252 RepID=A0AAD7I1K2_9AGAR|nr:hypothetical protein B0H16DRAFT_1468314 [Mycena metata]KAJ7733692.1 hypothetical protein B0H16DRAFT_162261 [Mycena metata]